MAKWVVVLLGGPEQECGLQACPGSAHGLFDTSELAREFAASVPQDFNPHVLAVQEPVLRDGAHTG